MIFIIIPLPKKLLTIFTLSPKLTNGESGESGENGESGESGENVRFVFWYYTNLQNKSNIYFEKRHGKEEGKIRKRKGKSKI